MIRDQMLLDIHHELIIDNFAGGGGASTGIEMALGRHVDVAINHDPEAVAMHQANHPQTRHYCESVWEVNPDEITQGRPIALVWLSPDCKHFTGVVGAPVTDPMHTVTAVDHHTLVTSHLVKMRNNQYGQSCLTPMPTLTAGGGHVGEVRAFLLKYYGADADQAQRLNEPMHTVTSRDRFGLVTVAGQQYTIADIGLRMLSSRELYRAQGFPETYIIGDRPEQGLSLTKTAQVRMCGNSVCPPIAAALVRANLPELAVWHRTEHQLMKAYA